MFLVLNLNNTISLSPNQFGSNIYKKIYQTIKEKYTKKILGSKDIYIIDIIDVFENSISNGEIDDITASVLYNVEYSVIAFKPIKNEIIEIDVVYCNDLGIWGVLHDLPDKTSDGNSNIIECSCPRSFIKDYKYISDNTNEIYKSDKNIIKKDSVISVKVLNFKISTGKIEILVSLEE